MKRNIWSFLTILSMLACATMNAAEPAAPRDKKDALDDVETVDIFRAMEEGKIDVQFIPKDASQATVIVKNLGDKPLNVEVPKAFGAVHVLPQMMGGMGGMGMGGMGGGMGGMGGGMGGMGGGMGGMGGQGMGGGGMGGMGGMGGGMGGMGGGMGGMGGMGGGMFRVAPDRPAKMKVPCVCLEHGKQDPNPRMKYKLVPIEQINDDPRVAKLCEFLGEGSLAQNTAQAAAWHMANGLSWQELAQKNRIESRFTGNVKWFNPVELQTAFKLSNVITSEYEKYKQSLETSNSGSSEANVVKPISTEG
ncbi:MAG: hypothetical protein R3C53_22735 [Pirellulaceae bacterium]